MLVLSFFIFNCLFCLFSGTVTCLEVELILEYETLEYKNTVMQCKYNLEGGTLGSVEWQKNGEKFFEYNRRKVPHTKTFPVASISLDEEKSNATHVFLTNLKPESSGEYSCFVSTSGGGKIVAGARENMTTAAREPFPLLVSTRKGFFLVTTHNYSHAVTTEGSHPVLSVDYHYYDGTIFYGQDTIIHQDFYESENDSKALPALGGALILAEEGQVTGIAVDWLRYTLYFTDDSLDSIGMVNLTSEERKTLLEGSEVSNPESIVVDPFQGYLFWGNNNQSDKKIVSSALDGRTNKQTIVSSGLFRAILALDLERRRLFFIGDEGLTSCKYDGSARRVDFIHPMLDSNVNALSYYDEFIFWSRYNTGKTSSGLFYARISGIKKAVKELPINSILDLKVFHPDMQRCSLQYSCGLLECSHGCTISSTGSAECTCPPGHVLTAGATVCSKAQTEPCEDDSQTIVNSVPACKGELVFEDNFDSSTLDRNKWQNTVRISSDHEMEFVTYSKDDENLYIKDGNLVVKPTLLDENIVTSGNISLIGCTTPIRHLCEKRAFSYSILPPVKSALINTAHAFNFRYGIITIRAKLPIGDWIYPVIILQATKDIYSPDYRSGAMRIVDVRGNEQLMCGGIEFGVKKLMSGVVVGPLLNVKKHFIHKLSDKKWTDEYHNFTFTWTPDNLSFSVDDEPSENIVPEGKTLKEVLGLQEENVGSRVDPLNSDVYLSMGVAVGGALEFPDDCTRNSGQQPAKPWRNSEVKVVHKSTRYKL